MTIEQEARQRWNSLPAPLRIVAQRDVAMNACLRMWATQPEKHLDAVLEFYEAHHRTALYRLQEEVCPLPSARDRMFWLLSRRTADQVFYCEWLAWLFSLAVRLKVDLYQRYAAPIIIKGNVSVRLCLPELPELASDCKEGGACHGRRQ